MFSPWWRSQVMSKFHVGRDFETPWRTVDVPALLSRERKSSERRMHINKLTGLHRDNVAKKAVPVSQTKTCQNDLPCRSTRHPPVSMIFSHGRSQVT